MKKLLLLIALIFNSQFTILNSVSAQTRKPAARKAPVATAQKPAQRTNPAGVANGSSVVAPSARAGIKEPRERSGNPAAKNPVAANNPAIKKAVNSNPQYKEVSYAIRGKAHGFAEGEWVKLCEPGRNGLTATDSVQIAGEDFSFRGKTLNVPYMKFIVLGQGAHKTLVEVFVEEGTISVDITADQRIDRVSGTTHNNIYTPYRDSINTLYTGIYRCTRESMRTTNSTEDREAYKLGADSLRQQIVSYTYTFARRNLGNWVGIYLFAEYHKRFTTAQNKALLAAVPKKYANLPIIAEIRKHTK